MANLLIYHQKGGVGKSVAAVNIAVGLAVATGRPAEIVDMDPQGSIIDWGVIRAGHGGEHIAAPVTVTDGRGGLEPILEKPLSGGIRIIDSAGWDSRDARLGLLRCDAVLIPQPPRAPDLWSLESVLEAAIKPARKQNPDLRVVSFLSRAETIPNSADNAATAEAVTGLGIEFLDAPLRERKAFLYSFTEGRTAIESRPFDQKAMNETVALAKAILDINLV